MKKSNLHFLIIAFGLFNFNFHIVSCECGQEIWSTTKTRTGRAKYIGLFSIASLNDSNFFDLLVFNHERNLHQDFSRKYFPKGYFVSIDVCNSIHVLRHTTTKILLDPAFSDVAFIISYMPYDMTLLTASVVSGTNIHLSSYSEGNDYPWSLQEMENMHLVTPTLDSPKGIIRSYVKKGASHIVLIDACKEETLCQHISREFVLNLGSKICIRINKYIGYNNLSNVGHIGSLENSGKALVIVSLVGTKEFILACMEVLKFPAETFVLLYKDIEYEERLCEKYRKHITTYYKKRSALTTKSCKFLSLKPIPPSVWLRSLRIFVSKTVENYLKHQRIKNKMPNEAKTKCEIKMCGIGTEPHYSKVLEGEITGYEWRCNKCNINYIKRDNGTYFCTPCNNYFQSNHERTECYDPYHDTYITTASKAFCTFLFMNMSSLCIILTITLAFLKKHRTPIIVSSDKRATFFQLSMFALFTILLPLAFYGKPTTIICTTRPIMMGLFLLLPCAINLIKSQKLLIIFTSDVRLKKNKFLKTRSIDIYIIAVIVVIDIMVLALAFALNSPSIEIKIYPRINERHVYCKSNTHSISQLIMLFILSVCNTIQSYRTKKLPSNYKEPTLVTLTSFTSGIILCAMSFVYFSQSEQFSKDFVVMYTATFLNLVHCFVPFGYKIFVVIFKPSINETVNFRKNIQLRIDKNVKYRK